jgi:hypothetical protein
VHLAGIHVLIIDGCNQASITSATRAWAAKRWRPTSHYSPPWL